MDKDTTHQQYYLQDSRGLTGDNLMFWGDPGGYTSNVDMSEVWTHERAFAQNRCRPEDIPWPVEYVRAHSRYVVDMQNVIKHEAPAEDPNNEFYLAMSGNYIGNDIQFATAGKSGYSTDLGQARVYNLTNEPAPQSNSVLWPKSYIDARKRLAMNVKGASLKEALGDAFTLLTKRPKPKAERYRCEGCGIFMTVVNYYAGACKRCDTDNRP
jgi:hypothetical protein